MVQVKDMEIEKKVTHRYFADQSNYEGFFT